MVWVFAYWVCLVRVTIAVFTETLWGIFVFENGRLLINLPWHKELRGLSTEMRRAEAWLSTTQPMEDNRICSIPRVQGQEKQATCPWSKWEQKGLSTCQCLKGTEEANSSIEHESLSNFNHPKEEGAGLILTHCTIPDCRWQVVDVQITGSWWRRLTHLPLDSKHTRFCLSVQEVPFICCTCER